MKSFWQPRSLSQLVLVSFFAALAPLGVAILFSVQTLGAMAEKNREITHVVLDVTRLGQEIRQDVLEIERHTRQYLAITDPELADLFELERARLIVKLQTLQERMPSESPEINGLLGSLGRLELVPAQTVAAPDEPGTMTLTQGDLDQEFAVIREQSKAVEIWLQSAVDQLLRKNTEDTNSHIKYLILQLSLLAAATLALLLLFARWINKPVKDLTQEIHNLGTSGLSHPIEISGPLELQALGSELEWLRQGLHESEQQKELFLRHISHELKTPLSSLREGADLLAEQVTGHLSQQQLEIVEIVRQNGIALQRLIENLIDYNRLPHQELHFEEIDLEALWQDLLGNYSISLNKKFLQLQQLGREETWVADRYKLQTSLDNLLSNAINYTPEGGCIDILWHSNGDHLVIDVANSGEPIPFKDAERVFEPFFSKRRQAIRSHQGLGYRLERGKGVH